MYQKNHIYYKIFILLWALILICFPTPAYAASDPAAPMQEAPAAPADGVSPETTTPEPTPTLPPSYFEPIQTNEIKGWPEGPAVHAESAVVMDIDTGTILYSKNIDDQKYPASITKIMTTLLAIENSQLNERVIFSDHAIWGIERDSSHIGIRIGENLSMKDCLYGMMLESANEVCLAVAEHIGGDVDSFVTMMNAKAKELGCKNTHFTNPNGLPDEQHYTTAHDMALIAKAAFENETFREVCSTKAYRIGWTNKTGEDRWLGNHHKMLWEDSEYYYEGCLGGKTGYTDVALNTLVTYANRNDQNLVCVTMRTQGRQVYLDTASLLDYGFTNFYQIPISKDKAREYSRYLLPLPSLFLNYYSEATKKDILKTTLATVPAETTLDNLNLSVTADENKITRTFSYNDHVVQTENIRQPAGVKTLFNNPEGSSSPLAAALPSNAADSFNNLPEWKYPMLALFGLAASLLIIRLILLINKHKKRKEIH